MTGYTPEPTVYNIAFAGQGRLDGLEVKIASMSMGERFEYDRMRLAPVSTVEQIFAKNRAVAEKLADRIISWNVLDPKTGQPVPPTLDGLLAQEEYVVNAISGAWHDALVGRSPLAETPTDGASPPDSTDLMNSIPVQPLTPNPSE